MVLYLCEPWKYRCIDVIGMSETGSKVELISRIHLVGGGPCDLAADGVCGRMWQ